MSASSALLLAPEARKTGLAGKMMSLIIQTATQQGYQTMNAEILKENTPMLKLAEKIRIYRYPVGNRPRPVSSQPRFERMAKQQQKQIKTCITRVKYPKN